MVKFEEVVVVLLLIVFLIRFCSFFIGCFGWVLDWLLFIFLMEIVMGFLDNVFGVVI